MSIGIMECWNLGMMGLKKPGFKTHMISFSHAQYSNVPSFHTAHQKNGPKKILWFSPRRRLYEAWALRAGG